MTSDQGKDIEIQLRHVSVDYAVAGGVVSALRDVSFAVNRGSFITVIGPSGCGKSTLLFVIAGIIPPSKGEVWVNSLASPHPQTRHLVGFVFQEYVLLPWRNVLENVRLPLEVMGCERSVQRNKPFECLELVGLLDFKSAYPGELSGGMKQRVGIARALATESPILLMDEPFSALDEITRVQMQLELLSIWDKAHRTIVFVTHNIEEAVFLSDQILILSRRPGQVVACIEIDLPRPRGLEILSSRRFFEIGSLVRKHLLTHTGVSESLSLEQDGFSHPHVLSST